MIRILAVVSVLLLAALAWGWWQVSSRGDLHVSLHDVALKNATLLYGDVRSADVIFSDAAGNPLASGRAVEPYGIVYLLHPDVGDCRSEERQGGDAWRRCFEAQSRWVMTWARDVRDVSMSTGSCAVARVPVRLEQSTGLWWLWWVPLPHFDNDARTRIRITAWIDSAACRAVDPASLDLP